MKITRVKHDNIEFKLALSALKGKVLKVGWVAEKFYPPVKLANGKQRRSTMTTAGVGYIAEFGSTKRKIPARPVMTPTNEEQKEAWKKISEYETKKIFRGEQTAEGSLEVLGARIAGDYRNKIKSIYDPPLAASTVRNRLRQRNIGRKNKITSITDTFRKPLIFDGILLNSVTHAVENEE